MFLTRLREKNEAVSPHNETMNHDKGIMVVTKCHFDVMLALGPMHQKNKILATTREECDDASKEKKEVFNVRCFRESRRENA